MHTSLARVVYAAAMLGIAGAVSAQELPTSQPKYLRIVREEVKLGRNAAHAKIEAGWPAAFERAKSPDYYLAMAAMTGANEVWFVIPETSNAAAEASMKRNDGDKLLSTELERLGKVDAEMLNSSRTLEAAARPDLSYGAYPDLSRQRYWEISWFRVRPGHEQQFDAAAKAYGAATKRVAPNASFRVYEIVAGMPGPTYLVFSSLTSYAGFDTMANDSQKTWTGMTTDELAVMNKFSTDGMINIETNRFQLSPRMSYVPQSVRMSDLAFWMPPKPQP
jgi:hypothetical protein